MLSYFEVVNRLSIVVVKLRFVVAPPSFRLPLFHFDSIPHNTLITNYPILTPTQPLAVQAILPISTKDISNTKPTAPPHSHSSSSPHENQTQTQLIPRPRISRFHWRHFFTLDPLPTDPYGPPPIHPPYAPPVIVTEPNMDKKTRDLYVKKAEAFQVTMLIAMPSPRRERERWGSKSNGNSKRSSGSGDVNGESSGEGSSSASGSGSESGGPSGDMVRWRAGEPVTIPPFTLGVARVDHKHG
ncbi:hypothetical protein BJ165DRAFT_1473417 [Panaeolus papilionaceus]|nr:hypothetical protein BJ165DRAFT_1473417 [Panaeolus papilionaceus]